MPVLRSANGTEKLEDDIAQQVTLQFHTYVGAPEQSDQAIEQAANPVLS